jgi:hypothetical protein
MSKTLRVLSLAALLTTGATAMAASGGVDSESVTGTQTGTQQVGRPAAGDTINTPNGQYTTNAPSTLPTYTYPRSGSSVNTGVSAQSSGQPYPGAVGPTGSTQPDATNPVRSSPSGGGSDHGGGSGSAGR